MSSTVATDPENSASFRMDMPLMVGMRVVFGVVTALLWSVGGGKKVGR